MSESKTIKFILAGMIIAIIIPSIFYIFGYVQIRKSQNSLTKELETRVTNKVQTYLSDSGYVQELADASQSGTLVSNEYEQTLADEITELVLNNISHEYKDELKNLVISQLYSDLEKLVADYYKEYTKDEIDAISEGVKTIVITELYDYISELNTSVEETKNLYTTTHELLNKLTDRTDSLEAKLAEIEKSYQDQIDALAKKDKELQDEIDALSKVQSSDISSLKSTISQVNSSLTKTINALSSSTNASTTEIYYDLLEVQNALKAADDVLQNNIEQLDAETAQSLADEISARKKAIKEALKLMVDEDNQIIANVNDMNEELQKSLLSLTDTVDQNKADLNITINSNYSTLYSLLTDTQTTITDKYDNVVSALKKNIAENAKSIIENAAAISKNSEDISQLETDTQEKLNNAVDTLNKSIDTLNSMLEEVDNDKVDISSNTKYKIEDNGSKITIYIPSDYPGLVTE